MSVPKTPPARAAGRYRRWRRPLVVEDPDRPIARAPDGGRVKMAHLDPSERTRLLIDGPNGLEPALFWLTEMGTPVTAQRTKAPGRTIRKSPSRNFTSASPAIGDGRS